MDYDVARPRASLEDVAERLERLESRMLEMMELLRAPARATKRARAPDEAELDEAVWRQCVNQVCAMLGRMAVRLTDDLCNNTRTPLDEAARAAIGALAQHLSQAHILFERNLQSPESVDAIRAEMHDFVRVFAQHFFTPDMVVLVSDAVERMRPLLRETRNVPVYDKQVKWEGSLAHYIEALNDNVHTNILLRAFGAISSLSDFTIVQADHMRTAIYLYTNIALFVYDQSRATLIRRPNASR